MLGCRTSLAQRSQVLGRPVAAIVREAVAGVAAVELRHPAVAVDLRDDRGGGDRGDGRIPSGDGPLRASLEDIRKGPVPTSPGPSGTRDPI